MDGNAHSAGAWRRPFHRRSLHVREGRQESSQPEDPGTAFARDKPQASRPDPYERRHAIAAWGRDPSRGRGRHGGRVLNMHAPVHPRVTTKEVFAIAGPAMVANLTTPLIGIVSTTAIGRLNDAALLGGVAMASVIFDCLFWLFGFLRMSTLAFTAQSLGAGNTRELSAILVRGFIVAGLIGAALIALQLPLAAVLFSAMGGSDGVTHA